MTKYSKEFELQADMEGLAGKDRQEWLKHRQSLSEAEFDDDKWWEETAWFVNRFFDSKNKKQPNGDHHG